MLKVEYLFALRDAGPRILLVLLVVVCLLVVVLEVLLDLDEKLAHQVCELLRDGVVFFHDAQIL